MKINRNMASFFLVLLCFSSVSIAAEKEEPQFFYNEEELMFFNNIYDGNYLVVTRKANKSNSPQYEYKLRYWVHSGSAYKVVFYKNLGRGSDSHITFGTLTVGNKHRTNGEQIVTDSDLFIWVEGQASNTYLFHATKEEIKTLFEGGEFRASYSCQDLDGDGVFEIAAYDTTWHAMWGERKKWENKTKGHESVKLIYRYNGSKYVLSDIEPDLESETAK